MASMRLWSPSKSQNIARTQKIKSNRERSEQLNLPTNDIPLSKRGSFFSKDSFDENQQKSSYQSAAIQNNKKSKAQSSDHMPILQSYKDSKSYQESSSKNYNYKNSGVQGYKDSGVQSFEDGNQSNYKNSGISRAITKKQEKNYKKDPEIDDDHDDQNIEEDQQKAPPLRKTRIMRDTKKDQKEMAIKKLDQFRVEYKKIQEIEDQNDLRQDARQFIFRLRREKRQFEGKIYLLKKQEQAKKKAEMLDEMIQKAKQKQIKKIERINQIQKRLENFKKKEEQRQKYMTRQRAYSMSKNKLSKLKLQSKFKMKVEPKVQSPSYRIGKKYLEEAGRIKKRVKTESSHYYDLNEQQRRQLDKIRQKIELLTKSIK